MRYIIKHLFDYVLLDFEHKNDVTIIIKLHRATNRIQMFDNDFDVIFMFKMQYNVGFHRISIKQKVLHFRHVTREPLRCMDVPPEPDSVAIELL